MEEHATTGDVQLEAEVQRQLLGLFDHLSALSVQESRCGVEAASSPSSLTAASAQDHTTASSSSAAGNNSYSSPPSVNVKTFAHYLPSSGLGERLYHVLTDDTAQERSHQSSDGAISDSSVRMSFSCFVAALAWLVDAQAGMSSRSRAELLFRVFDIKGDKGISREEMYETLIHMLSAATTLRHTLSHMLDQRQHENSPHSTVHEKDTVPIDQDSEQRQTQAIASRIVQLAFRDATVDDKDTSPAPTGSNSGSGSGSDSSSGLGRIERLSLNEFTAWLDSNPWVCTTIFQQPFLHHFLSQDARQHFLRTRTPVAAPGAVDVSHAGSSSRVGQASAFTKINRPPQHDDVNAHQPTDQHQPSNVATTAEVIAVPTMPDRAPQTSHDGTGRQRHTHMHVGLSTLRGWLSPRLGSRTNVVSPEPAALQSSNTDASQDFSGVGMSSGSRSADIHGNPGTRRSSSGDTGNLPSFSSRPRGQQAQDRDRAASTSPVPYLLADGLSPFGRFRRKSQSWVEGMDQMDADEEPDSMLPVSARHRPSSAAQLKVAHRDGVDDDELHNALELQDLSSSVSGLQTMPHGTALRSLGDSVSDADLVSPPADEPDLLDTLDIAVPNFVDSHSSVKDGSTSRPGLPSAAPQLRYSASSDVHRAGDVVDVDTAIAQRPKKPSEVSTAAQANASRLIRETMPRANTDPGTASSSHVEELKVDDASVLRHDSDASNIPSRLRFRSQGHSLPESTLTQLSVPLAWQRVTHNCKHWSSPSIFPLFQREKAAAAFVPDRRAIYVFGGESSHHNGLAEFSLQTMTTQDIKPVPSSAIPLRSSGHTMDYDWIGNRLVVFGGTSSAVAGVVHSFSLDTEQWTSIKPAQPASSDNQPLDSCNTSFVPPTNLTGHATAVCACYDPEQGCESAALFVFGGVDLFGKHFNELWYFRFDTSSWHAIRPEDRPQKSNTLAWPCARTGHRLTPVKGGLLLTGGRRSRTALGDVWLFSFASQTWTQLCDAASLPPLHNHATAAVGHSTVLVLGGANGAEENKRVYILSKNERSASWTVRPVKQSRLHPSPRCDAFCFFDFKADTQPGRVFYCGGHVPLQGSCYDAWVANAS